jgi:hypothetical protein
MHAQFIVVPTLSKVSIIFQEATGKPLSSNVTWKCWNKLSNETYEDIEAYIRPCHRGILEGTISGIYSTPCALIRQLIRPYGMKIDYRNKLWTLRDSDENKEKGIRTISGCVIVWD